jgi:two-component system nitrogen regulation response regulator GlnG
MPTLLVIDDDRLVLECLGLAFAGDGVTVLPALTAAAGLAEFERVRPDAVLSDIRLPDLSGLDVLARLRAIDPKVPVVLMTGHGTAETAIEAMRQGAYEYLLKPLDPDVLTAVVQRAFEVGRLMRVPAVLSDDDPTGDRADLFVGHSPTLQEVFKTIGRVAPTDASVLIRGETGTGKEMVARAIYHYSKRADKPFLAVNCAAIPETLLESELFGHEKGAFTGADRKRVGKFEQVHGGTLFLDEVGDMPPLTQSKILRVLQDGRFERVGGSEAVRTDVRIIAATNRDLETMMAGGDFREDLFYRLNVCPIRLPPLRERPEDIPLLVTHFLRRHGPEFGKAVMGIAPAALERLTSYRWPGNVRQLQSVVKQGLVRATGPTLTVDNLPAEFHAFDCQTETSAAKVSETVAEAVRRYARDRLGNDPTDLHAELLAVVEREVIVEALRFTNCNLSRASLLLGIARPTLRAKIAALGLGVESTTTVSRLPNPKS